MEAQTSTRHHASLDPTRVNAIRTPSTDAVRAANPGHPGAPTALAPSARLLRNETPRFDPEHPTRHDRDRFVLPAGHASSPLYSILRLKGVRAVNAKHERAGGACVTPKGLTGEFGFNVENAAGAAKRGTEKYGR